MRGSSEAVGSSRRTTSGRSDSTEAIAARFFSPPDSSKGARSARWAMPISARASSHRSANLLLRQAELERPEGHVVEDRGAEELDVRVLEDEADLAVEPEAVLAGGDRGHVAAESPRMLPWVGPTMPSRSLSSVDLPLPLAPSSATRSPGQIVRVTPSRATCRPAYVYPTSRRSNSGSPGPTGRLGRSRDRTSAHGRTLPDQHRRDGDGGRAGQRGPVGGSQSGTWCTSGPRPSKPRASIAA